jgi:hypothetical protein
MNMDLKEIRCEGVDWIHLAQDRDKWRAVLNTAMSLQIPYNSGKLEYLSNY